MVIAAGMEMALPEMDEKSLIYWKKESILATMRTWCR
jgi:hypothetical protein